MAGVLEFFFEFRSPYSYLALSQIDTLGLDIVLKPINVVTLMGRVGNSPTSMLCAPKGAYLIKDLGRWAQRYDMPLTAAAMRQIDADSCLRAVAAADTPEQARQIADTLFRTCWGEGKSLENKELVLAAIANAGIAAEGLSARMDDEATAAQIEANTEEAIARGVFGIPTMLIDDAMFFGNDRFDFIREHLGLKVPA